MKKILLTGATDGIGRVTAEELAKQGHYLFLHGRNAQKLQQVQEELLSAYPQAQMEIFQADLSILAHVHSLAKEIAQKHNSLDVIINNAGIFVVDAAARMTKDGLDVRLAVNTVAPFILTTKLMPLLHKESRVVNVSSAAQAPVDFALFTQPSVLDDDMAYAQSKLALIMWTMEMAHLYPRGPLFIAVNPKSFLGSKMVQQAYGKQGYDLRIGADILCQAALSADFSQASGKYFDNDYGMFSKPHPFAHNAENRKKLFGILEKL